MLFGALDFHAVAAAVEQVRARGGAGNHLEGHGALHLRVVMRIHLKKIVRPQVHQDEFPALQEPAPVRSRAYMLPADFERHLSEQIGLVFFLDAGGIAGIIHEAGEKVEVVGKMNAAGIAQLRRGHFAAKENCFGKKLLPPWAKTETDDSGDLILQIGTARAGAKTPGILVVAHMDEIGYVVKSISKDGRLEVDSDGGGVPSYFEGHPALVHTATGDHDAVMELPNGWDEPNFKWPTDRTAVTRVDVGARTPEEVAKLGIKAGDTITIPKAYRALLGARANGRSFDDRVGDTALISATWALGGPMKDRNVTFVFSTGEELGLYGAGATAKRLAAEGHPPDYVFAVDTFVSSDSPLESKRFGDAEIGKGFVIRAVDNSNIVRTDLVQRVIRLARDNQIPVQFGVTGGGNDGSAFVRYGSADIALGWPLRYSHSPGEVIDTRDVDALAHIITAIAKSW